MGFLKKLSARNRALLVITLLLSVLIPVTVYSALQRVSTTPQAATNTLSLQVSSGNGDAFQSQSGGAVNSAALYIEMVSYSIGSARYSGGFRFTNVTIPKGSTINSAVFQVYVYGVAYDDPNVDIFANGVDNAKDFATENTIVGRVRTSNSVSWVATNLGAGYKSSPDIKSVIQEVINRPGWVSGNSIALLVDGRSDSTHLFWARSYEYPTAGGSAAKLTIVYTPPTPTANIKANGSDGPITIAYNSPATISWSSTNATSCSVSPAGWTGTSNLGISTGNLTSTKTYTLNCTGDYGPASDSVTVNVNPPPKPTVNISANPSSIKSGQSSTLSWSCTDGTSVSITANPPPNIGTVGCSGSKTVTPTQSTTYTAVASGPGGDSDARSTSITVDGKLPPSPSSTRPSHPAASSLETLQLEISVPQLIGKMNLTVEINGVARNIQAEGHYSKIYSLDLKDTNVPLNQEYNLIITGDKTLIKKIKVVPQSTETKVAIDDLILGDINQDNSIDWLDQLAVVSSIASRSSLGDLDASGATNSFDWAILLTNFGKRGD